jgi:hypothetical protein
MLQYRLTNETDDFVEGSKEQLTLFIIKDEITYEHHIDQSYDIKRVIDHLSEFTVEYMDTFINIKYYSMTFRLNPIGDNIHLIISLRSKVAELEKKLEEINLSKIVQKVPDYLPPNLILVAEIQYLPWNTLEDLFYMYPFEDKCMLETFRPLDKFNGWDYISRGGYKFKPDCFNKDQNKIDIDIISFDPVDIKLDDYIISNKEKKYFELSKSCNPPYTKNKKINIHILNFIKYIFQYYIFKNISKVKHEDTFPSIECFINYNKCILRIVKREFYTEGIKSIINPYKYRMSFYMDNWEELPVVVYV